MSIKQQTSVVYICVVFYVMKLFEPYYPQGPKRGQKSTYMVWMGNGHFFQQLRIFCQVL